MILSGFSFVEVGGFMKETRKLYFKYLIATFGGALITSIYSIVDAICVGQYHGEDGSAALAVVMPLWTIIYSMGLLLGIGGATLMTTFKAKNDRMKGNSYFTLAIILGVVLAAILWIILNVFHTPLLVLFGAKDSTILEYAKSYTFWMKLGLPVFFFAQLFTCFIRNDQDPSLATIAIISGGVLNIFGDLFFVFQLNMGIYGAGLATLLGQILSVIILCMHFFKKKNTCSLVKIHHWFEKAKKIFSIGIPSFILDVCLGIIVIIFNNQINTYTNNDPTILAVYGVICNMSAFCQCFGYAVGQANQPLLSDFYGRGEIKEVKVLNKYGILTCIGIGSVTLIVLLTIPNYIIQMFVDTSDNVKIIELGSNIMRSYFLLTPFLILNIYATYYFQAVLKSSQSFVISILRGLILPLMFLFFLPMLDFNLIWYGMFISEGITCIVVFILIILSNKKLDITFNKERR